MLSTGISRDPFWWSILAGAVVYVVVLVRRVHRQARYHGAVRGLTMVSGRWRTARAPGGVIRRHVAGLGDPTGPHVYIMRDADGAVRYVGVAGTGGSSLADRLHQHGQDYRSADWHTCEAFACRTERQAWALELRLFDVLQPDQNIARPPGVHR